MAGERDPSDTQSGLDPELRAALGRIARVPQLLIGCDYDGTLAPLVDDPAAAGPLPEAVAAVRALAALPQTVVAVISGRALRDLATLSRLRARCTWSEATARSSTWVLSSGSRRSSTSSTLGCSLSCRRSRATTRDPARDQAGERRRARPGRRAGGERAGARGRPQRAGIMARDLRHERQERHRAVAPRHRQGRCSDGAPGPGLGQRRPLPG